MFKQPAISSILRAMRVELRRRPVRIFSMNTHDLTGLLLLMTLAGLGPGCTPAGPIYEGDSGGFLAESITPRTQWTPSSNLSDPAAAIDNDLNTAASAGNASAGYVIVLDLAKPCLFQTIIIDHGPAEMGYCGAIEVATSIDGRQFVTEYRTFGTRRVTIISLPEPTLGRYVRLQCQSPGPEPWSVAEIYLQ